MICLYEIRGSYRYFESLSKENHVRKLYILRWLFCPYRHFFNCFADPPCIAQCGNEFIDDVERMSGWSPAEIDNLMIESQVPGNYDHTIIA